VKFKRTAFWNNNRVFDRVRFDKHVAIYQRILLHPVSRSKVQIWRIEEAASEPKETAVLIKDVSSGRGPDA
jgi:hypothetical protein